MNQVKSKPASKAGHQRPTPPAITTSFNKLGLPEVLIEAVTALGYERATPIQAESIPILLRGGDLVAQAQTGTGKTAAFALPILSRIEITVNAPQVLVVVPTRELAIQVAEAFQSYAQKIKGFHVAPIYGGQDYRVQLKALKRGVHVIVGTPGRLMDHLRRGTLSTECLKTIVLDEADEMLKMGFISDIEWILEQLPEPRQTALFSATIPASIQKIAKRYMQSATKIHIKPKEATVNTIEQFYYCVSKNQKLEALTRFLEVENLQAAIIFTRTRSGSSELAEKLQARGYSASALNGDMNQAQRKIVIDRIKKGSLDIVVATDVAARGIDVDRISHVINFDIPHDPESYIHRIGRTGRAGRKGTALLFVAPREQRLLADIERTVHSSIKRINPPSLHAMKTLRSKALADQVVGILNQPKDLSDDRDVIDEIASQGDWSTKEIAAALACLVRGGSGNSSPSLSSEEIEAPSFDGGSRARKKPSSFKGKKRRPASSDWVPSKKKKSSKPFKGAKSTKASKPKRPKRQAS